MGLRHRLRPGWESGGPAEPDEEWGLSRGPSPPAPDAPVPPALPGARQRKPGGAGSGLRWGRGAPPSPRPGSCFRNKPFPRGYPDLGPSLFLRAAGPGPAGDGGAGARSRWRSGGGARASWSAWGGEGPVGRGEGKRRYLETSPRCLGKWGELGPRKPGSHGARWEGAAASCGGLSVAWRRRPGPGGTGEGQPQAVGVPNQPGPGEPVTVSGLWVQTHLCETTRPKTASDACPSLAPGWEVRTSPTLQPR